MRVLGRVPARGQSSYVEEDPNIAAFILREVYNEPPSRGSLLHIGQYVNEQLSDIDAETFYLNAFSAAAFAKSVGKLFVTNHEYQKELDYYWGAASFYEMARII